MRRFNIPWVRSVVPFKLSALEGIEGHGPLWTAKGPQVWFEIDCTRKLSNCWLRLTWQSSLVERPSRPILRFEGPFGTQDHYLPAAVFGRQSWIGHVPKDTRRILLSPVGREGTFGFELTGLERLGLVAMLALAYRRNIPRALLASLTTLIQMHGAARINLGVAVRGRALTLYDRWRRECSRPLDYHGIDAVGHGSGPHIRFVVLSEADQPGEKLVSSLRKQPYAHWSMRSLSPAMLHQGDISNLVRQVPSLTEGMGRNDLIVAVQGAALIAHNALLALAQAASLSPEVQAFYGDQDRVDGNGSHFDPQFYGRCDPLLAASGYYRPLPLFRRVGSLDSGGAEIWSEAQPLSRLVFSYPQTQARRPIPLPSIRTTASVSIIIPTRDRYALLSQCVESIFGNTGLNFEIIIVDNGTKQKSALRYISNIAKDRRVTIIRDEGEFNFSRISNAGSRVAKSDYLIFLNNDIVVDDPAWAQSMLNHARQPLTGAVGMKLLYRSGRIQHVGAVAGLTGIVGHIDAGLKRNEAGLFDRNGLDHQMSAVTGACLMIRKDLFQQMGGFDEESFPVEYNDIDLCYRLLSRGYRNVVVCSHAITHLESRSRGKTPVNAYSGERKALVDRWSAYLRDDPYYHPGLSLASHSPRLG